MTQDPREAAARYAAQRDGEHADARPTERAWSADERAAVVETAIQHAIRQGAFDDLPGAGEPIRDLGTHHDPDWWIRRKIEAEDLHGLGPGALTLRVEDDRLQETLDALTREADVREHLDDFNARVRRARMQLQGGPPVVTPLRDVAAEVAAWRSRRAPAPTDTAGQAPRRRWFRRR